MSETPPDPIGQVIASAIALHEMFTGLQIAGFTETARRRGRDRYRDQVHRMKGDSSVDWRKSTYSSYGSDCVEVSGWRKSSYSIANGDCAEAASENGRVVVRDTQDREGFVLEVPAAAWRKFLSQVR